MVHVLGPTPDGTGWTIYVIEPHANAVFADARLPFEPSAWAVDVAQAYPSTDRQQILAFGDDGPVASVEIGKHAFAWRLPGVIAGALMAGLLYLLARILFRRREVGVLVGIFAIADGMLFVQSRIGMNDAYVGLGIVAAYTLFAAIWTGSWRWRGAFWVAMPVIGVFLGLALASKWVALYAIGGTRDPRPRPERPRPAGPHLRADRDDRRSSAISRSPSPRAAGSATSRSSRSWSA